MNLTVVAMEIPFPPIHGGRVDIWRRIVALSNLGVKIQLVCWMITPPSQEEIDTIQQYVEDFHPISYERGLASLLKRGLALLQYPLQVTSRLVRGDRRDILFHSVEHFSPDVILADHVHCGLLAKQLSETFNVPYVLRSHDIEHLHYGYWMNSAQGIGKLKLMVTLWHLKSYEFSIFESCLAFYDISIDDLEFWQQQGFTHGKFLPPLIDLTDVNFNNRDTIEGIHENLIEPSYDVVFLGNLRTENNVAGVIWFLEQVLPLLKSQLPTVQVLIAGSNPVPEIIDACNDYEGVTLKANPVSAKETYCSGKVLINPVLTGSGTSIKSIDMFTLQRPIVTLEKGVVGLPHTVRKYFKIASDAQTFSQLILESLTAHGANMPSWQEIEALFGYPVIEAFIKDLEQVVKSDSTVQVS